MKICFVALHAYPVVEPNAPELFGGAETRAITLANGMAKYTENEVSFIVRNPQLKQSKKIDAVEYISWRDFWTKIRDHVASHLDFYSLFRFRIKKWSYKLLWEIPLLFVSKPWRRKNQPPHRKLHVYQTPDFDFFFCFGVSEETAIAIYNASLRGSRSLVFVTHDENLDATSRTENHNSWVLKNADQIIVQTEHQQQLLKVRFNRESIIIPNPIELAQWQKSASSSSFQNPWGEEKYILWIGRADTSHKIPSRLLKLAELCPTLKFLMVMNPFDFETENRIKKQASSNVKIIDTVPYHEMPGVFRHAKSYVNTSAQEGFANVFLQAVASQVPVLSYEVGVLFLEQAKAGLCVNNNANLARDLLLNDSLSHNVNPQHALDFLKQNHLCQSVCTKLNSLIEEMKLSN